MKGISTVIAVILIVIIVVALVSLTYTFAISMFTSTTTTASKQTQSTTENMMKTFEFVSVSCSLSGNTATYKFTLRSTGTVDLKKEELAIFLDNERINDITPPIGDIIAGTVDSDERSFTNSTATQGVGTHTIKVSSPAYPREQSVACS